VGLGVAPTGGGLETAWVSDTPRDTVRNHHAVGHGSGGDVIVAPVTEVPGDDVRITGESCSLVRLSPSNGSVVWRAATPPATCFSHALTEPAVADVDGDGGAEVLAASTADALVAYDAQTGQEDWRVSLSTYGYGRPTVARLPTADAPGDGGQGRTAVVVSDIDGTVVRVSGDGSVRWRTNLTRVLADGVSVIDRPVVADLAGDDTPEIVVGTNRGVVVLGADGAVRWQRSGPSNYLATVAPNRSEPLVVTASYEGVRALEADSGDIVWERTLTSSRLRTAADGDGDGTRELFVGRIGGEVLALDARTGETEWTTSIAVDEDAIVPPPVTADVAGDGRPEVLAATEGGRVVVLDPETGAELAGYERSVPIWTFVRPVDLDDDGDAEVLVRYGDGRVIALQYTAAGRPLAVSGRAAS